MRIVSVLILDVSVTFSEMMHDTHSNQLQIHCVDLTNILVGHIFVVKYSQLGPSSTLSANSNCKPFVSTRIVKSSTSPLHFEQ